MNNLQAQIILKNRVECMQRVAKLGERCGRCSVCPFHTSLDDYITARLVISQHTVYKDTDAVYISDKDIAGEHTKAVLDSLCKEVSHETH